MKSRAEFPAKTRRLLAERAGYQCSVLNCGRLTIGPAAAAGQVVRTGMAAHIYAASDDGPRGTGGLSPAERMEPENGIWCCYSHGKVIDADDGNVYSVAQLKGWKRLHEARKSAEVNGWSHDRYGLVDSINIASAPASISGMKFELGMRNLIVGPNGSGKTVLTRLIASVAHPDHVADLSRARDVDFEVRWFDPQTHDVATSGRAGRVTHVLDGAPVPYVARPYKTIVVSNMDSSQDICNIVALAQTFDLSRAALAATLSLLDDPTGYIKEVQVEGSRVKWLINDGHRVDWITDRRQFISLSSVSRVLIEIAGIHAGHHARVEPTFVVLDGLFDVFTSEVELEHLERLQQSAEHAQIALISPNSRDTDGALRHWTRIELPGWQPGQAMASTPIEFEVDTFRPPHPDQT